MKDYFNILEDTGAFIILNKEAGVDTALTVARADVQLEKELYNKYKKNYQVMFPMDYHTSGALILSLDEGILKSLREDLNNHQFHFIYDVIIQLPLFTEQENLEIRYKTKSGGKLVIDKEGTLFSMKMEVVKKYKDYAHLKIFCPTPLDHAIRLGLSFLGSPVASDTLYGMKEPILLSTMKRQKYKLDKEQKETPIMQRPAIHLSSITYKNTTWNAPLSKDIRSFLFKLDKYNRFIEEIYFQDILEHLKK